MSSEKRIVHYVVSTHWDREWYEPFQGFRFRLVNMLDELFETMQNNPAFNSFQTDGQAVLIEDYLAIRPEREATVRELAAAQRLEIGPWFVQPDEFLVSGESLIRNLRYGLQIARRYGSDSRAGFVCDIFGHNSQLPQILRGFGIQVGLIWRGTNESERAAMFRWEAADGSDILVHRFGPRWGYCDYAFRVRKCHEMGETVSTEQLVEGLVESVMIQSRRCPTQTLLLFDGGDHMEIDPRTPEVIELANRQLKDLGFEIKMSTLSRYAEELLAETTQFQDEIAGELREPGTSEDEQWLIPGVLSSRIPLKQANHRCETLLCLQAEPLYAFAQDWGAQGFERYFEQAWRYLLLNHPHDSICGCSIDQVHKDMEYRFDQSSLIAQRLVDDMLDRLLKHVPGERSDQRFPVLVANPLTFPRHGAFDIAIQLPQDAPCFQEFFGFEKKYGLKITDAATGAEIPYQLANQKINQTRFFHKPGKFPQQWNYNEIQLTLPLELPAMGSRVLWVECQSGPTRYPGANLAVASNRLENQLVSVQVEPNGTLTLCDKHTQHTYRGLLELEDCADIGDGWYHGVAVNDEVCCSTAASAVVAIVANGPAKAVLRIEQQIELPERFDFAAMRRSNQRTNLRVTHWVTLRSGARCVEVHTEIDNTVRDHRLRVLFPTDLETDACFADSCFDILKRPIQLRENNHTLKELEVETRPQNSWTAVCDEKDGLAVVSCGFPEAAVLDQPRHPIALTLYRAFQKAVFTAGNKGGQLLEKLSFDYRIIPFEAPVDAVMLGREGQTLSCGTLVRRGFDWQESNLEPVLPPVLGRLHAEGRILVSSVRITPQGEWLVRLFNPDDDYVEGILEFDRPIKRTAMCDFNDNIIDHVEGIEGQRVYLKPHSRQILNIMVELA